MKISAILHGTGQAIKVICHVIFWLIVGTVVPVLAGAVDLGQKGAGVYVLWQGVKNLF